MCNEAGVCFDIQSDGPCLLTGVFKPFISTAISGPGCIYTCHFASSFLILAIPQRLPSVLNTFSYHFNFSVDLFISSTAFLRLCVCVCVCVCMRA
jgi:hypothetical protein